MARYGVLKSQNCRIIQAGRELWGIFRPASWSKWVLHWIQTRLQIGSCKLSRMEIAQASWARTSTTCFQSNHFCRLNKSRSLCASSETGASASDYHICSLLDLIQKWVLKPVQVQTTTASILYRLAEEAFGTLCCVMTIETINVKCK